MDNQRLILYLALGLIMLLIWQAWQADYAPETVREPTAARTQQAETDSSRAQDVPEAAVAEESPLNAIRESKINRPDSRRIHVVTDVLDVLIDTRGGDIRRLALPTYPEDADKPDEPVVLLDDQSRLYIAQSGLIHDKLPSQNDVQRLAPSHHATYQSKRLEYQLQQGEDAVRVLLTWTGPSGVLVTKTYTFRRGEFLIELEHEVDNRGEAVWSGRQYRQLRHGPIRKNGSYFIHTYTGAAYYDSKYEKLAFDEMSENPLSREIQGGWVAMLQHYFVSAWAPPVDEKNYLYTNVVRSGTSPQYIIGLRSQPKRAAPGESVSFESRLFAGPKLQHKLERIAQGLELTTDYGIFTVLSKPLFWLLEWIHKLVGNWGWAIIILTIMIKLAFYKLSEMSYRSMAKMRTVQPRMKTLRERYGDDKQKMNQALMDLYKKEKINPLGGCLPILVQIPVFIALYWVLIESVELRQADFMLWLDDLSSKDPYFVLPVLMGITMLAQQRLNPAPPDPIQAKVMAIMPFAFTVFFAFFPSGLVLYWFVNNLLSIAQQWVITRRIEQQAAA